MPHKNDQVKEVEVVEVKKNDYVRTLKTKEGKDFVISNKKELGEVIPGTYRLTYSPITNDYKGKEQTTRWVSDFERIDGSDAHAPSGEPEARETPAKVKVNHSDAPGSGKMEANWPQKDAWSRRQSAAKAATDLTAQKAVFLIQTDAIVGLTEEQFEQKLEMFWRKWFQLVYNQITLTPGFGEVPDGALEETIPF